MDALIRSLFALADDIVESASHHEAENVRDMAKMLRDSLDVFPGADRLSVDEMHEMLTGIGRAVGDLLDFLGKYEEG